MTDHLSVGARPRDFQTVVGQERVTKVLRSDVSKHTPRHVALTGASGTGKTTIALIAANAWLCEAPVHDGSPCRRCEACTVFERGNSPDFMQVNCPTHGNKDDIEWLLTHYLSSAPFQSRYRVVLFDEAQGLSLHAQEMLLDVMQASATRVVCMFTAISPDALIVPLRDRARLFRLDLPDFDTSVAYLIQLATATGIVADLDAIRLIAAHSRGFRNLAESLDTVSAAAESGAVTVGLVRASLLRDRSHGILAFLSSCARGNLEELLHQLNTMTLSPKEKVTAVLEVLKHLIARFTGQQRVRKSSPLSLLLPDEDCQRVVGLFAERADELGRTVDGLFDELLQFWLELPSDVDECRLDGHALRFHRLIMLSRAPAENGRVRVAQHAAPLLTLSPPKSGHWRRRDRTGLLDRGGQWLTLQQARELYEAATFLCQHYGMTFNACLTIEHLASASDTAATEHVSKILKQLRRRFFEPTVSQEGPAFDLHRIAFHERGSTGALLSAVVLHLPPALEADVRSWLAERPSVQQRSLRLELDAVDPRRQKAAVAKHWNLVRSLWGGLDPSATLDGETVLDILMVPPSKRRPLGSIQGRRFNVSQSIGDGAQQRCAVESFAHISAWADREWPRLFGGWELAEYKDRVAETRRRNHQIEQTTRSYSSESPGLERTVLDAALAAERASWPPHPKDRKRSWRVWWDQRES